MSDPLFDITLSLAGTRFAFEGVAEWLRRFCQRGTGQPVTNAEHCLLSVLYERLDAEAARLAELEHKVSWRRAAVTSTVTR